MIGNSCDHCGAETSNGLALCTACQGMLVMLLEYVPIYFRNLSRWRPSSSASERRSSKSKSLIDMMVGVLETGQTTALAKPSSLIAAQSHDRIGDLLDEVHVELVGWLDALSDDRPEVARVIARLLTFERERMVTLTCALLVKRAATLTTLPWVRDITHGVLKIERQLRVETERSVPGWYAGTCTHCKTTPTYVLPGLTWVTCQGCGAMTHASDHVQTILGEARDWIAPPMRIAEAVVALVDTEHSVHRLHKRIVKWGDRGRITSLRHTRREHVYDRESDAVVVAEVPLGHARYRFDQVIDIVLTEKATRPSVERTA